MRRPTLLLRCTNILPLFSPMNFVYRSVYGPYDPFLATSLAQVQAAAAAAGNPAVTGVTDPRLQVRKASLMYRKFFIQRDEWPLSKYTLY